MQRIVASRSPKVCYLCCSPLGKNPSKDHVPPQQFYARIILQQLKNLNLLTLQTHETCNQSFQKDEDYFVNTLIPHALNSPSGWAVGQDVATKVKKGKELPLINKVVNEFEDRPSGLILPGGLIVKRFDIKRIRRVAWKIIRGLHFHHEGKVLPEATPYKLVDLLLPGEGPGKALHYVANEPSHGQYPGVFDYKYVQLPVIKWPNLWAFLLWDSIRMVIAFQNLQSEELKSK